MAAVARLVLLGAHVRSHGSKLIAQALQLVGHRHGATLSLLVYKGLEHGKQVEERMR